MEHKTDSSIVGTVLDYHSEEGAEERKGSWFTSRMKEYKYELKKWFSLSGWLSLPLETWWAAKISRGSFESTHCSFASKGSSWCGSGIWLGYLLNAFLWRYPNERHAHSLPRPPRPYFPPRNIKGTLLPALARKVGTGLTVYLEVWYHPI